MRAVFLFFVLFSFSSWGFAYTDSIQVPADEVFAAVQSATEAKPGIAKANAQKRALRTQWVEDKVYREGGLLRAHFPQKIYRRYRMHFQVLEKPEGMTELQVKGKYQQRMEDRPAAPYRSLKPSVEEHKLEREYFHQVLRQIAHARQQS